MIGTTLNYFKSALIQNFDLTTSPEAMYLPVGRIAYITAQLLTTGTPGVGRYNAYIRVDYFNGAIYTGGAYSGGAWVEYMRLHSNINIAATTGPVDPWYMMFFPSSAVAVPTMQSMEKDPHAANATFNKYISRNSHTAAPVAGETDIRLYWVIAQGSLTVVDATVNVGIVDQ